MPYTYLAGAEIKVWRATREEDPYSSGWDNTLDDGELNWDLPILVSHQLLRPVAPSVSLEVASAGAPLAVEETLTVYLIYGTQVLPHDRVEVCTGPYTGVYEVDGPAAHWENPYTGNQPGTSVKLGRKTGGG